MTTDPGDLYWIRRAGAARRHLCREQWGRRWITCDSSRVALALAKHRLMTAKFDFYNFAINAEDVNRNPNGTWIAELDTEGKRQAER